MIYPSPLLLTTQVLYLLPALYAFSRLTRNELKPQPTEKLLLCTATVLMAIVEEAVFRGTLLELQLWAHAYWELGHLDLINPINAMVFALAHTFYCYLIDTEVDKAQESKIVVYSSYIGQTLSALVLGLEAVAMRNVLAATLLHLYFNVSLVAALCVFAIARKRYLDWRASSAASHAISAEVEAAASVQLSLSTQKNLLAKKKQDQEASISQGKTYVLRNRSV